MGFLAPLLFGLSALSIPIFLLYMLRLRRTDMQISSTFLWQQLVRDREANAPWQRLRPHPLLLLQLLILAALVLSLMRPYQEVETFATGRTVLLVDASASMNSRDVDDDSRFEAAKDIALDNIDTLGGDDTMTIIRVAEIPEVLAADSRDRGVLRRAIREAEPGSSQSDWESAFALAAAGGRDIEDLQVVILSDGGLPTNLPEIQGKVQYEKVGTADDNLAISALAIRALPNEAPQLFAKITNFGDQDAEFIFQLDLNGSLYSAETYTVGGWRINEAGEGEWGTVDIFVTDLPANVNYAKATLIHRNREDYLADDDVAYTVFNQGSGGTVLLVTERNIFLEEMLRSLPGVELTVVSPEAGLPVSDYDLYIFDEWVPVQLPRGDIFFINPTGNTSFFSVTGTSTESAIDDDTGGVLPDDPRTQYLSFGAVNIREFSTFVQVEWADVLVQTAAGRPLLMAGENGGQQVAILAFALQDSDLPLQIAFPIMMSRLLEWFSAQRAISIGDSVVPGSPLAIRPTVDADEVKITKPDGETVTLSLEESPQVIFADTIQLGLYRLDIFYEGREVQRDYFAVNLFSDAESRIAPSGAISVLTVSGQVDVQAGESEIGRRELWNYLAGLAILVLILEWIYYYYTIRRRRPRFSLNFNRGKDRVSSTKI